jgi:hypothetical protein
MPVPVVIAALGKVGLAVAPTLASNLFAKRAQKKTQAVILPKGAPGFTWNQNYTYVAAALAMLAIYKKR